MLKKSISLVLALSIILIGCANKSTIYRKTSNNKETEQFSVINDKSDENGEPGGVGQTIKPLNSRTLKDKEIRIANKPILRQKYLDLIKSWGEPNNIEKVKVYIPATETENFSYILKYDGIEIQMYPAENNISIESTESFLFDITNNKYEFYGTKVGTSLNDYLKSIENKDVFTIKEIFENISGEKVPYEYRKILTLAKKNNYYDGYEKAIFERILINGFPYGAVMLFKDDKLSRIVLGLPNAG